MVATASQMFLGQMMILIFFVPSYKFVKDFYQLYPNPIY